MHDSPEKQTLTQGWLLKDVDYVNILGMAVWFLKLQYKSKCLLLPLPPLCSTLPLHPTWLLYLVPIPFSLGFLCLRSFLWISFPSFSLFPLVSLLTPLKLCPIHPLSSFSLSLSHFASVCLSLWFLPCSASVCLSASSFSCFLVSLHLSMYLSFQPLLYTTPCCLPILLLDASAPGSPPNKKPPGVRLLGSHAGWPCEISQHPLQIKRLTLLKNPWQSAARVPEWGVRRITPQKGH